MKDALPPQQQLFVQEYLVDLNATEAYIRAGYTAKTRHSAEANSHKLIKLPKVQEAVAAAMAKRIQRIEVTADWVLERVKKLADAAGKDSDRLRGLELLGKHLKLWTEKFEVTEKKVTHEDIVLELARKRAAAGAQTSKP
jgi:phage terminase small subunit